LSAAETLFAFHTDRPALAAKPSRRKPPVRSDPDAGESRGAVALTVAWMLSCTSTAVAMLVVAGLWLLSFVFPFAGPRAHPLVVVAGMLLFVALATGLLCLLFTPLAYRVRQTAPPRTVAVVAVLIGLSPLITFVVLAIVPH
jgi:hypothetical protein